MNETVIGQDIIKSFLDKIEFDSNIEMENYIASIKIEAIKKAWENELEFLNKPPVYKENIIPINLNQYIPPSIDDRIKRYLNCLLMNPWYQKIVLEEFELCHLPAFKEKLNDTQMVTSG